MSIVMAGLNHQVASVKEREKVAFSNIDIELAYEMLKQTEGIKECVILNTCNRMEIYAYIDKDYDKDIIISFLLNFHNLDKSWSKIFYTYKDEKAVEHLYKVAIGLDSMVLGEDQILGQVKNAYSEAYNYNCTDKVFNTLFKYVITSSKKIRTEILGNNKPLSISTISIEFLKQKFKNIKNKKVFVLGVGKISTITIKSLIDEGVGRIYVANRTKHKAKQLKVSLPNINVVSYEDKAEKLANCDIVISSTSAPHYVVTKSMLEQYYNGQTMCFVDLSIPRDIDPDIEKLDNVKLYTLDNLQEVSNSNFKERKEKLNEAKEMLTIEIDKFWQWYRCQSIVPTISYLQDYYTNIVDNELDSLMKRLEHLDNKDRELIHKVSNSMARKMFNNPILNLKEYAKQGDTEVVNTIIRDLFKEV